MVDWTQVLESFQAGFVIRQSFLDAKIEPGLQVDVL